MSKAAKRKFVMYYVDAFNRGDDETLENLFGFFPSLWEGLGEGAKLDEHKPSPQPSPRGRGSHLDQRSI